MLVVGDDGGLLLMDPESHSVTAFENLLLTEEEAGLLRISHPEELRLHCPRIYPSRNGQLEGPGDRFKYAANLFYFERT